MKTYIELEEAVKHLKDKCIPKYPSSYVNGIYASANELNNVPRSDVVEVVRCKDCKHCEIVIDQFDNDWYFCKNTKDNADVKPDDFCSYGERSKYEE